MVNIVVIRPAAGRPGGAEAYEGWDRAAHRRVVVRRHQDDAAARAEFRSLEEAKACSRNLVVRSAGPRLLEDHEVDFRGHAAAAPAPGHPRVVVHTHPGTDRLLGARAAGPDPTDAELRRALRPAMLSLRELHRHTRLAHLDVGPDSFAAMWSGRCTLAHLGLAAPEGRAVDLSLRVPQYVSPELAASAVSHKGADAWAFGVMLFQAAHGERSHPLARDGADLWELPDDEVLRAVRGARYDPRSWTHPAPLAAALCAALLRRDVSERETVAGALRRRGLFSPREE